MNILYISSIGGSQSVGPTYSIPAQIGAQSRYDNVFWYNSVKCKTDIFRNLPFYHDISDYDISDIKDLPKPFDDPDLVVFELVYNLAKCPLRKSVMESNIPYIIVPRSNLTKQAQKKKQIKKIIGNMLIFNRFVKRAAAVQYLTKKEEEDSSPKWNYNHFIISNGIDLKKEVKKEFSKDGIEAVYIGRLEPYQKGLDLLIKACGELQDILRKNCFLLKLYGTVKKEAVLTKINQMIVEEGINDFVSLHQAVYDERKKAVLLNADVFIMTSRFEGQPMGLLEAVSYGLPCVVTEGTYMMNDIHEYNSGWGCETTVKGIKEALIAMIKEQTCFAEKSNNAIKLAEKYSWDSIAEKSHEEYMRLVCIERK